MKTNQIRSNMGALTMRYYEEYRADRLLSSASDDVKIDSPDETVRDVLADIMHYCALHNIDFENELRIAGDNFNSELEEDDEADQ